MYISTSYCPTLADLLACNSSKSQYIYIYSAYSSAVASYVEEAEEEEEATSVE